MNTKRIKNTPTASFPHLPTLTSNKCSKVITKHFCNVGLYLSADLAALFWWLLYQSGADGSFSYNTNLLRKYVKSVSESRKLYSGKNKLTTSVILVRSNIQWLISNGYLFWMEDKLIINPMFSYYERLSRKEYLLISEKYQNISINNLQPFLKEYVKLVKAKEK